MLAEIKEEITNIMMDYKNSKSAQKIIELQNDDGTWGQLFHSLALPDKRYPLTTEQALRRLRVLGFTIQDVPIQKAVDCMTSCLLGERKIDDYWEKTHDWELFTKLMLSTWIRVFEPDNEPALKFAKRWSNVIEKAFVSGTYNHDAYLDAYMCEFSSKPQGGREHDFSDFYHIQLLQGVLSKETENRMLDYIITRENGIYYIYDKPLNKLPNVFVSIETSRYLAAIEILAGYRLAKDKLGFVVEWLEANRDENGQWDLGAKARDNVYLPLSDSWRKPEYRKVDCTERITTILQEIKGND